MTNKTWKRLMFGLEATLFVAVLLFVTQIVHAQTSEYTFNVSLYRGTSDTTSGGQVSQLQRFLKEQGDFTFPTITGYFGPITEQAVKQWQARNGVVSSGTPESTGHGVFGPLSRSAALRSTANSGSSSNISEAGGSGSNSSSLSGGNSNLSSSDTSTERTFLWAGRRGGFTDQEIITIADKYPIHVITMWHGTPPGFDVHHADARRIKEANVDIDVVPYFFMSTLTVRIWNMDGFDQDWILRDKTGNKIEFLPGSSSNPQYFVDLSIPEYRTWALDIIAGWHEEAPYSGIAFDGANPLGNDRYGWEDDLPVGKIAEYNRGMELMLEESHQRLGAPVIYNGIAYKPWRENRNLGLLDYADIALNEGFCYTKESTQPRQINSLSRTLEDIQIMEDLNQGKRVLQKVNYLDESMTASERADLGRYCYGVFLLGHQPGQTYFKFGYAYHVDKGALTDNPIEMTVDLGSPSGSFKKVSGKDLYTRKFEEGLVVVNLSDSSSVFTADRAYKVMNTGRPIGRLVAGNSRTIQAHDALFLIFDGSSDDPPPPPQDELYVRVLSPQGPQEIVRGSFLVVKWEKSDDAQYVNIVLDPNEPGTTGTAHESVYGVASLSQGTEVSLRNIGETVSGDTIPDGEYYIRACLVRVEKNGICDYSENRVTLVTPDDEEIDVELLSPSGGETVIRGSSLTVRWNLIGNAEYVNIVLDPNEPGTTGSARQKLHGIASLSRGGKVVVDSVDINTRGESIPEGDYYVRVCVVRVHKNGICDYSASPIRFRSLGREDVSIESIVRSQITNVLDAVVRLIRKL